MGLENKPIITIVDAQDAIINPDYPRGDGLPHLLEKADTLRRTVRALRASGKAEIAWVVHSYAPGAQPIAATQDLALINQHLRHPGDAFHAAMEPRDGDLFFLKTTVGLDRNPFFANDLRRFRIAEGNSGVAGFYAEECVFALSIGLAERGIPSTILLDLSDNHSPLAADPRSERNIRYLARTYPLISWTTSAAWLETPHRPLRGMELAQGHNSL